MGVTVRHRRGVRGIPLYVVLSWLLPRGRRFLLFVEAVRQRGRQRGVQGRLCVDRNISKGGQVEGVGDPIVHIRGHSVAVDCVCLFVFCFLDVAHVSVGRWLLRLCLRGVALGRGRMRGLARWRKCRSARAVVYWK